MTSGEHRRRRILYAVPAGDPNRNLVHWQRGEDDPSQLVVTYSHLFFDMCDAAGWDGIFYAPYPTPIDISAGPIRLIGRRPTRFGTGSARFLLGQLRRAAELIATALRQRATDVILADGTTQPFMLWPLAWAGCRIYITTHTVLWPHGHVRRGLNRWLLKADGAFLRRAGAGILAASPAIADQLDLIARHRRPATIIFDPLYRREDFAAFKPAERQPGAPFRLLYAGRVEIAKGMLDLVTIMRDLRAAGRDVTLDICGSGGAYAALAAAVREAGLADCIHLHGHLDRPEFLPLIERADALIVPTRTEFVEGLNQVVIEAVLARRPVITSAVCPALDIVRAAAIEAMPDDPASYRDAIIRLMDDPALARALHAGSETLRDRFFDPANSWRAAAERLLRLD